LAERHPDLFAKAVAYEEKVGFEDTAMRGRQYRWSGTETLKELVVRKEEIMAKHEQAMRREKAARANAPLVEVLSNALDDDDSTLPCQICNL
jgi:hypothetical protein